MDKTYNKIYKDEDTVIKISISEINDKKYISISDKYSGLILDYNKFIDNLIQINKAMIEGESN